MPTLTALMVELTKDMSYEELVQIKEEAEEEARLEIERIENMSAENRMREIYNKGYKDGIKEGIKQAMQKIADSILEEVEADRKDEPQTMIYPQVDGITPSVIEPKTDCIKCKHFKKGRTILENGHCRTYMECMASECPYETKDEPQTERSE